MLLHGDLHHWNILQDKTGAWKAIDPKGVVGPRCLDSARFIQNQLEFVVPSEKAAHLREMFTAFATALGENESIIAKCYLIDTILSTCWSFEDNVLPEKLAQRVKICEFAWQEVRMFL